MAYRYYSLLRPVSIGTYPKPEGNNLLDIHNYSERTKIEGLPRGAWGWLEYEKPLTTKEMLDYDLFSVE